ncbi:hypothetical protein [Rossellomorea marisflavi]|uniref:hypothetical protein n=1 Tax=Rossellomorea marisflavi TaxID=189381 RepID=UPI00345D382E
MNIATDFFILDSPIETDIGKCHFIKVRDFPTMAQSLNLFSWSKSQIIYNFSKANKDGSLTPLINELKPLKLFAIVRTVGDLNDAYTNVFKKVLGEDTDLEKIDEKNFDNLRKLIMKMNCLREEKINPNPEIQKAIERSKRVKQKQNGDSPDFGDMASSIVSLSSNSYEDLANMTLYQFHMTYYRIAQIKAYDTSTLFATVPSEGKKEIEDWSKHIDLFKEDSHFVTESQFKSTTGNAVNG